MAHGLALRSSEPGDVADHRLVDVVGDELCCPLLGVAADLSAIDLAAKIPGARFGSVEVRPVMNYEGAGAEDTQQSAAAHN